MAMATAMAMAMGGQGVGVDVGVDVVVWAVEGCVGDGGWAAASLPSARMPCLLPVANVASRQSPVAASRLLPRLVSHRLAASRACVHPCTVGRHACTMHAYTAGFLPAAPARARPPVCLSPASILQRRRWQRVDQGVRAGRARQADCAIDEGLGAALTRRPAASTAAHSPVFTNGALSPSGRPACCRPKSRSPRAAIGKPSPAPCLPEALTPCRDINCHLPPSVRACACACTCVPLAPSPARHTSPPSSSCIPSISLPTYPTYTSRFRPVAPAAPRLASRP